jgi:hypothetical protein
LEEITKAQSKTAYLYANARLEELAEFIRADYQQRAANMADYVRSLQAWHELHERQAKQNDEESTWSARW